MDLRRLAITCDFGNFLDQALRDRFICGLKSQQIQKSLLAEDTLTMARALEIAQAKEAASRDAKDLKGTPAAAGAQVMQLSDLSGKPCYRCGRDGHRPSDCRFKQARCHKCGKVGHIAPACKGKRRPPGNDRTQYLEPSQQPEETERHELSTFTVGNKSHFPIQVELKVDGKPLTMQVDTGAAVSILAADTFRKLFPNANLHPSTLLLRTYTGETMKVLGELPVRVQYDQQGPMELELVVVQGHGPALFARNWLKHICLNWKNIGAILYDEDLTRILSKHDELFSDELGTIHPFSVKLSLVSNATPKFCKARQVPYALRGAVEEELDRLEHRGVLERVDHANWATPILAVPKKDGKTRICGDYKVTINPVLEVEQYPLPKPEDLFATLAGGKRFTTLDLSHAYNQLVLDEDSQELVTINTHRGLFRYRRLPFGIASAPAVFQKTMDVILQGMSRVTCYLDDILVTGATAEEHLRNLDEVLTRLKKHGVRLRKDKCRFMESSVEYLGHRIDQEGIHATTSKLQAISEAPAPRNVQELRSFLGLLNYFGPNLSSLIHPLHKLLCKNAAWKWSRSSESAFNRALLSSNALVHYNPSLPLKLAGDASTYGVGAVISHVMEDGSERAIAFASRTLSPSEQNYAQLEKEALSLVFGVKKFHAYLYGRQFTLTTDHKPLTTILGPKQGIPTLAAARLQRWALLLAAYTYQIEFRSTGHHANANSLSRLPLPDSFALSDEDRVPVLLTTSCFSSTPVIRTLSSVTFPSRPQSLFP